VSSSQLAVRNLELTGTSLVNGAVVVDVLRLIDVDRLLLVPRSPSHEALDRDEAVQEEARNVARVVVEAVRLKQEGKFPSADETLRDPRPK